MTYAELKIKYMLKEITKEEYERGKAELIYKLFTLYEKPIIDEEILRARIKLLNKRKRPRRLDGASSFNINHFL